MDILYDIGPLFVWADGDDYVVDMDMNGPIATFDDLDDAIDCANDIYDDL